MTSSPVTHPQLVQLVRELEATSAHATRLVESHDDRTFSAKPAPNSWSAAEAIAHLTITNQRTIEEIERALARNDGRTVPDTHRYRMDFVGTALRWSLEPPYRIKTPTAPGFVPEAVADRRSVLADFLGQQRAVAATIGHAQGRDLSSIKITSIFNTRVRYNVFAALRVITTHNRRHLWQAERALSTQ
jgi:hypothetical protein